MWWSRPLGSQKRIVGLQQTQAGNAPTIVRHAILVLPSPFWLEVSLVSLGKGRAVGVRHTEASCVTHSRTRIIATPTIIDCESLLGIDSALMDIRQVGECCVVPTL